ncbi:DUF6578 domain-containing protein [Kineococcus sp. GCM10028916]|uniref:DUF6578 domain-containing protein n=1 Tax=Kineococcus sp. GCM10028916 TaxID=3273394 RepID=UPI00363591F2
MDVVVEVGGWEHECCGGPVERDQVVDFTCLLITEPSAQPRLVETHHDLEVAHPFERVRGRVVDVEVVLDDGSTRPVLRVPGGTALCGFGDDDGHLEDPWTGEIVVATRNDFLVTVRVPDQQQLNPVSIYQT